VTTSPPGSVRAPAVPFLGVRQPRIRGRRAREDREQHGATEHTHSTLMVVHGRRSPPRDLASVIGAPHRSGRSSCHTTAPAQAASLIAWMFAVPRLRRFAAIPERAVRAWPVHCDRYERRTRFAYFGVRPPGPPL